MLHVDKCHVKTSISWYVSLANIFDVIPWMGVLQIQIELFNLYVNYV